MYSLCRYLAEHVANLRIQPVSLGETLLLIVFRCAGTSAGLTLLASLSTLTLPEGGGQIYPRVRLEEYFGVCSQPCIRLDKGDPHSVRGGL